MREKKKICMIVQDRMVKGGIAAVVNGYRGSRLEKEFRIRYVESYKDGGKFTKLLKGFTGYLHFAKVLILEKPELVHIHSSFGMSFYRKIPYIYMASWANKPIINHCHGAEFDTFYLKANVRKKRLIEKIYNKCSMVIALSDEWKERLSLIVPVDKIEVIENYSIIHEDAVKERVNRLSNSQILFLGEIGQRKGCYDIPAVVEKVVEKFPDVKFVLGGTGDIVTLKSSLREKGVEKNVIFPGWVRGNEKDKLLRESDIFFLPSYNEGMPMSILDAMGYGLPIVSTLVGGIPKIVHNGENGYVCEPGDVQGLSNALIEILMNEYTCKKYANSSLEIVKQKYSLDEHIKRLTILYLKLKPLGERT
ncbi:N-acetyl-alpha-D-glucosaminyl L-malate synthase [Peribacillus simplex]|uniref:glycosyltransferase family 4 protein n=1 Tax=Peribacillus simplex TaxID=1478 RepID=UPI001D2C7A33|nr:glycosyltransferase family 4 protein [Peribacillus simplex]CAH0322659.1 N-acetyl-alpha-D-glucosaminyl L-malate synthase [Peribacillus simplex]